MTIYHYSNSRNNGILSLGPPGKPGEAGPAGPPGPKGEAGGSTGGVVYTRWGRKHCPQTSGNNELYSGISQ